ncbi:MAG: hypothetical protein AAGE52_12780 [Myxococcota bacterium]
MVDVNRLAGSLVLGDLLESLEGEFRLRHHWKQGEFHHDVVLALADQTTLVVATNCNGGVKEVIHFAAEPTRGALWHRRCPESPEFSGALPKILAEARTTHWFDPCELLRDDARSELRPEFRQRQPGGGWTMKTG